MSTPTEDTTPTQPELPAGYEWAEVSHAKNLIYDVLVRSMETRSLVDPHDEELRMDPIGFADDVIEALLAAGITIPEDLPNPHGH